MMHDPKTSFMDDLFAQARTPDAASDDLMARVLADADATMLREPSLPTHRSWWQDMLQIVGGWPAMGSVAAAGVAGLWVGLAPPATIETWVAELLGTTTQITLLPDLDGLEFMETFDG